MEGTCFPLLPAVSLQQVQSSYLQLPSGHSPVQVSDGSDLGNPYYQLSPLPPLSKEVKGSAPLALSLAALL